MLLATAAQDVTGAPAVAFDGLRWLVVWIERTGASPFSYTWDLRAVAIEEDGTVLDATPRLLASDVSTAPAAASTGDGRVLVVFGQPSGGRMAVRAMLVTP